MRQRTIKSFVRRQGRLTARQQQALTDLWSNYGIDYTTQIIDLDNLFNRTAPCVLEIGFGMGHSLAAMAQIHPEINYLGVEVHLPGVGALLATLQAANLRNVRVILADAVEVLTYCVADNSLTGVQIFFPDPWPKQRHHKRRLIQPYFVNLVVQKLQLGGYLHLATDWEDYAWEMLRVLHAAPLLQNSLPTGEFLPRDHLLRPVTKFEKRGQGLGYGVWDLLFIKKQLS